MDIHRLLEYMIQQGASDLHLSANEVPMLRIDGDLARIEGENALSDEQLTGMLEVILPTNNPPELSKIQEYDFSFELPKKARFRVNIFKHSKGLGATLRAIPIEIASLEDLQLPPVFKQLCHRPHGIVLVTGPTGSGKSTTLAAMVDYVNINFGNHIITIEDPVEFVHQNKRSLIQHREAGHDTQGFNEALRAALREDPDNILIGEMRDIETIRLALTAAETGHLVFATLHTNTAPTTIDRIVDVFPAAEKELVRAMLASSLQAVICQTLLKRKDGGRVPAFEIMLTNTAIRNLIRENKVPQLYSAIQTGKGEGMMTMEQSIEELQAQGIIR